jgi:glycosyltransferase involved in cell wall biosynthesis
MVDLDLLVVPSLLDGNPSTVYEGLGANVPVLLTSGCGASNLLSDGVNCLIAQPSSNIDLYEKIIWSYYNRYRLFEIGQRGFIEYKKLLENEINYSFLHNVINDLIDNKN